MRADRELRWRRRVEHALDVLGLVADRLGLARLATWLARPLLLPADVRPAAVIVVLCGGCRFNGRLNEATSARVAHGVQLFEQGLAPRVILSGGRATPHRPRCAPRMRTLAVDLGLPADRITVEDRSSRTVENAREVARLLGRVDKPGILLVTGPLHMRRARRCFERQGVAVACAPVPRMSVGGLLVKEVIHEYVGLAYYALRRW
jgi:uncharacterized SAM-binding protein YcdF (DUF218 family)